MVQIFTHDRIATLLPVIRRKLRQLCDVMLSQIQTSNPVIQVNMLYKQNLTNCFHFTLHDGSAAEETENLWRNIRQFQGQTTD